MKFNNKKIFYFYFELMFLLSQYKLHTYFFINAFI